MMNNNKHIILSLVCVFTCFMTMNFVNISNNLHVICEATLKLTCEGRTVVAGNVRGKCHTSCKKKENTKSSKNAGLRGASVSQS